MRGGRDDAGQVSVLLLSGASVSGEGAEGMETGNHGRQHPTGGALLRAIVGYMSGEVKGINCSVGDGGLARLWSLGYSARSLD